MTAPPTPRLQKVLAATGLASRRVAEQWIAAGRVTVDGRRAVLGDRVDPEQARIEVDGVPVPVKPGLVYYLVNKPAGVVTTADDPQGRSTVIDLVPDEVRLFPVGRLDLDSEGLLLLTNDGELANLLTHPRYGVTKTYVVLVEGVPTPAAVRALTDGVELEDGPARALVARLVGWEEGRSHLELVMGQGRKRVVRRMCDAIGHPVLRLFRTAVGPLTDRTLAAGEYRRLTADEVRALYQAAGRSHQSWHNLSSRPDE